MRKYTKIVAVAPLRKFKTCIVLSWTSEVAVETTFLWPLKEGDKDTAPSHGESAVQLGL